MLRNILIIVFALGVSGLYPTVGFSQATDSAAKTKRTNGVKIAGKIPGKNKSAVDHLDQSNSTSPEKDERAEEIERLKNEQLDKDRQAATEKTRLEAENNRLERERNSATADKEKLEAENARLADERTRRENTFTDQQAAAAEEKRKILAEAASDKEQIIRQAEVSDNARKEEIAAKELEITAARQEAERLALEKDALLKRTAEDAKKLAEEVEKARGEAEKARLEAEKVFAEKEKAQNEVPVLTEQQNSAQAAQESNRKTLIELIARRIGFLKATEAFKLVPEEVVAASAIEAVLVEAVRSNPRLAREFNFCDAEFVGQPFNLELTADDTFGTLLEDLRMTFGVNFLPDAEIIDLPIRGNVQNVPWNYVLRNQINFLDLEARCDGNTISLIKRSKLLTLQESIRKTAPVKTEYIKLKYLRPVIGGQSNLAGKATGAASIESLEQTIQKILTTGGDNRGSISRIPGRAEFFITATDTQLEQIRQVIAKADRPTYRVDVFGLVYTISDSRLKDVGSQLSLIVRSGGRVGGLTTLPDPPATDGDGTTPTETRSLPAQFAQPGGLQAGAPNTILGAKVRLGLVDFNYQLSLLEQLGVARRVEKPFVSAKDGTTGTFENGTQIPVVIQSLNNFGTGGGGTIEFINAGTTLSVTPQVIENAEGNPQLVNLALRLESNTPDLSIQTTGGVPSVNSRRIQNEITIAPNQAFIFGGANDVFDANNVSRTPVLGNLPILGNLFKRKTTRLTDNKLYFAVWVQISLDDGSSPLETDTLNTNFPKPPAMDAPLTLPEKKP